MKRIFLFALIGLMASSCKKGDDTPSPKPPVKAERERNPVLFMVYSSSGQAAGPLEAIRESYEAKHEQRLGHVNLVTDPNDPMYTVVSDSLSANFDSPTPFTYIMDNQEVNLATIGDELDVLINTVDPFIGVVHTVSRNDTAEIVNVKLQFYEDTVTSFISVETYQLVNVEAKLHLNGTYDLRQAADGTYLVNSNEATLWKQDVSTANVDTSFSPEVIFHQGEQYVHRYVPLRNFNEENVFGTNLSEYTKFAPEFFRGDQIGLKQNPIQHYFLKEAYQEKSDKYDYPYTTKYLTVVWFYDHIERKYNIVNAYMK